MTKFLASPKEPFPRRNHAAAEVTLPPTGQNTPASAKTTRMNSEISRTRLRQLMSLPGAQPQDHYLDIIGDLTVHLALQSCSKNTVFLLVLDHIFQYILT